MLAVLGFFLHLTAGCLIISRWNDVPKTVPDPDHYRGKALGLGSMLIMQSFVMLAEAGLQALKLIDVGKVLGNVKLPHNAIKLLQWVCSRVSSLLLLDAHHFQFHLQILAMVSLLLAYTYTCHVEPRDGNPLMGYCNLISITKASPLTHFVVIGYFILINIQIASILTEDNSPFKVRAF